MTMRDLLYMSVPSPMGDGRPYAVMAGEIDRRGYVWVPVVEHGRIVTVWSSPFRIERQPDGKWYKESEATR